MNQNQAIETLKQEANKSKIANAVFHVFATRQRARQIVTLNGLWQRMKEEGFSFSEKEYTPVLKLLADLGFGTLMYDRKGEIYALKDIKNTLQSIGLAACGDDSKMKSFRPRAKYSKVIVKNQAKPVVESPAPKGLMFELGGFNLNLSINGKPVQIPLSKDLSSEELTHIVEGFKTMKAV